MSSTEYGSIKIAALAATSGNEVIFDVMTGTSDAKASSTGRPNPSYNEGNIIAKLDCSRAYLSVNDT